jgi:CRISPR-associated endoribonuclease Cas6
MFLSLLLPLTPHTPLDRRAFLGREAHAWFLSLVGAAAPALAEKLHADEQRKPFTVSGVRRYLTPDPSPTKRGENLVPNLHSPLLIGEGPGVRSGSHFVRVTSLSAELSALLLNDVLPRLPETARLGETMFTVGQPIGDAAQHPWAGQTTAEALLGQWFAPAAPVSARVVTQFASPTAFKRQGRLWVTPLPAPLVQSWLMAWNTYAAPKFESDLVSLVERDALITRYRLRTVAVSLRDEDRRMKDEAGSSNERLEMKGENNSSLILHPKPFFRGSSFVSGFVGTCALTLFSRERALWRTIHLLADFALYCGTGYKTTQGMGQTRRVTSER